MKVDLKDMIEVREGCENKINEMKNCETCKFQNFDCDKEPCCHCYDEMLGLPVNPTQWEKK